jgi:hypothetical protein
MNTNPNADNEGFYYTDRRAVGRKELANKTRSCFQSIMLRVRNSRKIRKRREFAIGEKSDPIANDYAAVAPQSTGRDIGPRP